ncbi:MAG: Thymidylate kinase [bacterium ADurb.Bin429]|nr:MAG: Thymidylate kinase [bacterium ADurb.Bin429]
MLTREPGGTALGERLREILLNPAVSCADRTELMLMLAARAQHVAERIRPALAAGQVVITDRFSLSSLAYQGYGRGLPLDEIRAADAVATGGLRPDLTLVVDVPLETAMERLGAARDRIESEGAVFLRRVIAGYHALAQTDTRIRLVDGRPSAAAIHQAIIAELRGTEQVNSAEGES